MCVSSQGVGAAGLTIAPIETARGTSFMYPANSEPSLDELLSDPIARLLMQRDRLRPDQVRSCLGALRHPTTAEPKDGGGEIGRDAQRP